MIPEVNPVAVPVRFVAVQDEGVPNAPQFISIFTHSTATTPADTRERVVSEACQSSTSVV